MLIDADGTRHPFSKGETINSPEGFEFTFSTTDGSLVDYHYFQDRRTALLGWGWAKYPDGTVVDFGAISGNVVPRQGNAALYPTRITDANGNYISITYRNNTGPEIDTVTDTLGRTIRFHYTPGPGGQDLLTAVTGPGLGGQTRTFVRLNYMSLDLDYGFRPGLPPVVRREVPQVIKAIYY